MIVSAFYNFILEKEERLKELALKSTEGSSLIPILAHLFSGALIFESLLKKFYLKKDDGNPIKTLGNVFHTTAFTMDFSQGVQASAESLQQILDSVHDNALVTALTTTAQLRNTTGHNLILDNVFDNATNYETLFNQVVNALFYVIEKKFIR